MALKTVSSKYVVDRRTVLRGSLWGTVVSVALPALDAMLDGHGVALAAGKPLPRRLGIWFWGNGVRLDKWIPKEKGKDWTLTEELAPLANVKDYVSVISGMNVKTGNERGHHAGCVGMFSGAPMISQPHPTSGYASTFSAPSIDQIFGDVHARKTPFRSLEVGVSKRVTDGEGTTLTYLSHRGPDSPCPPEYDPDKTFDRLFGLAGKPGVKAAAAPSALAESRDVGKSVLDVVGDDLASLRKQVGAHDGRRLDQHLDNVRDIEKRLTTTWRWPKGCALPQKPADFVEDGGKEPMQEINQAQSRLLTLALQCDLTRAFSMMFSGSVSSTVFWQVGADKSHHQMTHDEPGDQPLVHAATIFTMKQFAYLLEQMKAASEGAGNLLDNTVILASTDLTQGKEHKTIDYPILIAGRAGGRLKHPGVHYRSDGENTSKVLLSILRSVGLPLKEFGRKDGRVTEGCSAIET